MSPLLNYTTSIPIERTVGEITGKLAKAGASQIGISYGANGAPVALAFVIQTGFGEQSFRLPANAQAVQRALIRDPKTERRYTTTEHAGRVAWRIVKDWLEAQLALIEAGQATLDQIFLPYLETEDGRTIYQLFVEKRLALPAPREAVR